MSRQSIFILIALVIGLLAGFAGAKHLQTRELGGVGDAQVRTMLMYTSLLRPINGRSPDEAVIRARVARSAAIYLRGAAYHYPEIRLKQNRQALLHTSEAALGDGLLEHIPEPEYKNFVSATALCITRHPDNIAQLEGCIKQIPSPYAEQMHPAQAPPS
ncbi:hypothetical protein [Luteimonas sp. e5]